MTILGINKKYILLHFSENERIKYSNQRIKEGVSKVRDTLFLFGILMESCIRLRNSEGFHFTFDIASLIRICLDKINEYKIITGIICLKRKVLFTFAGQQKKI